MDGWRKEFVGRLDLPIFSILDTKVFPRYPPQLPAEDCGGSLSSPLQRHDRRGSKLAFDSSYSTCSTSAIILSKWGSAQNEELTLIAIQLGNNIIYLIASKCT